VHCRPLPAGTLLLVQHRVLDFCVKAYYRIDLHIPLNPGILPQTVFVLDVLKLAALLSLVGSTYVQATSPLYGQFGGIS